MFDVQMEQQKAIFNELVGNITSICYDKCISKPGGAWSRYIFTHCKVIISVFSEPLTFVDVCPRR